MSLEKRIRNLEGQLPSAPKAQLAGVRAREFMEGLVARRFTMADADLTDFNFVNALAEFNARLVVAGPEHQKYLAVRDQPLDSQHL